MRKLLFLSVIFLIMLTGCGKQEDTKETTASVNQETTENTTQKPVERPTKGVMEDDGKDLTAMEMLKSIVLGKHSFINAGTKLETDLVYYGETGDHGLSKDEKFAIKEFIVVDLDGDGIKEVLAWTNAALSTILEFHYEDGIVYMYENSYGGIRIVYSSGVCLSQTTAYDTYYYETEYDKYKSEIKNVVLAQSYHDTMLYYLDDKEITEEEFNEYKEAKLNEVLEPIPFTPDNVELYIQ